MPSALLLSAIMLVAAAGAPRASAQTPEGSVPARNQIAQMSATEARIVPPSPLYRFPNGKTLVFAAEWHVFSAGTATLRFDTDGAAEKLTVTGTTSGAVHLFFPVNDRFAARLDPVTFCTTRVSKHSEEGQIKRDTEVQFDYGRRKSVLDEQNGKTGEVKHEENDIPPCITDILSGFFYLASRPLQPGTSETFPVNDGGKTSQAIARVEGREEIIVPAGTFHAIRILLEAASGKLQGKGKLWVWYTDDAEHTPVQMRAKLGWGSVMFKLRRIDK
jgi:hypothetical protein